MGELGNAGLEFGRRDLFKSAAAGTLLTAPCSGPDRLLHDRPAVQGSAVCPSLRRGLCGLSREYAFLASVLTGQETIAGSR